MSHETLSSHKSLVVGVLLSTALLLAYVPDLGHGFVKDDFRWIRGARVQSVNDAAALLTHSTGFYRPLVSVTFALNYAMSGMAPFAYGATNFGLLLVGAALLFLVSRRLGLPDAPSALAASLWAFNFHGINMAVLWASGRTALLLTCASLASTLAALNGRMMIAGVFCLLAMLSKEEAVVLPILLACWLYPDRRLSRLWPLFAALAIYLVLRLRSAAFWPSTAPAYYQFTIQPSIVFRNALEYLDRGATCAAVIALMVAAAARARPILSPRDRRILALAALWFALGYAITVLIPVRSSLYAVFPSIGACIGAAVVVAALIRQQPDRTLRILAVSSIIPLLLVPVYRVRNVRWAAPAELSATVLSDLRRAAAPFPHGIRLVLIDDPAARFNLGTAFGALLPDAVALTLGDRFEGEVVTAGDSSNTQLDAVVLALRHGRLEPDR